MSAVRPVGCPYVCQKPVPSTMFVRFHPLRSDAEIRQCPACGKQAVFPTGEKFRKDWDLSRSSYVGKE